MDTVYLIMQGTYSDRHVCYATLDKDKAEQFVKVENLLYDRGCDEYDIEEYGLDGFEIQDMSKFDIGTEYHMEIDDGKIYVRRIREAVKHNSTCGGDGHSKHIYCNVWLNKPDTDKAKKIAYDMYMKKVAEDNGL